MSVQASKTHRRQRLRCDRCGRRLPKDHYIRAYFRKDLGRRTRYCWPGEGCNR